MASLRSSRSMIFQTFKQPIGNLRGNLSLGSRSICIGLTLGWPESSLSYLLMNNCGKKCHELVSDDGATVQIIMNCGSCIGALVPSCIADTHGRKLSFAIAGTFNIAFWAMLIIFQGHAEIIFVAAVGGIAAGAFITTTALYVSEISLPQRRCAFGALAAFCAYVGALFGNCLIFIKYIRIIGLIMIFLATFFLVSLHCWMIESPYFLFLRGRTLDAKLSLKILRGAETVLEIDPEYKTIELFFRVTRSDENREKPRNAFLLSISRQKIYAVSVIIFLCVTQMVGAYGINDYSMAILNILLPNYGRIVISFLDVVSVGICLYVINKISRRNLLFFISVVGSSVSCLILAIITIFKESTNDPHENNEKSLVLISAVLVFYYTIYSLGVTPVLPILTGEIFLSRRRTATLGLCVSFIYLASMIIQFSFELLHGRQGLRLAFVSFAIFGALGIPFVFIFLLGSQGRALHEIQEELDEFPIIIS